MKILVAEDEPIMLKTISLRLTKDGHQVIATDNGREALEQIAKEQPDLIITDIMMPYSSGLEIVGKVKQSGNTPVIVLSSMGQEKTVLEAFSLGADDYITKPFSPLELSMRVKRFCVEKRSGLPFLFFGYLPLLKQLMPYQYLLDVSAAFFTTILLLLTFIFIYLIWIINRAAKRKHLVRLYSNVISEIILCDSAAEREAVMEQPYVQRIAAGWFRKKFGRQVLITELVQIHRTIGGQGGENICWLYNRLELDNESLRHLASQSWHKKTRAIQQLAEMRQTQCLPKLYKASNDKNKYVRNEAQVAIVKLTGFDGLLFLNVVTQPISTWQQLCLLRELALETKFEPAKIKTWIKSSNDSVVAFNLRLIKSQHLYELHDEVLSCLFHTSASVRRQALDVLIEISTEQTFASLLLAFNTVTPQQKYELLKDITSAGYKEQLPLLRAFVQYNAPTSGTNSQALLLSRKEQPSNCNTVQNIEIVS